MALDPYYNNVSLLLPMEGANNQVAFPDYSPDPATATPFGNAKISTAESQWGQGSGRFDGDGDYLSAPDSAKWDFSDQPFTAECWVYNSINHVSNISYVVVGQAATVSSGAWLIEFFNGFRFRTWQTAAPTTLLTTIVYGSISTLTPNQWFHLAVTRDANKHYRGFVNGELVSTQTAHTGTLVNSTASLKVGAAYSTATNYWNGYLQDLRITKGVARYTANFTPPGRLLTPELYGAKYLHRGTLPTLTTITGNCIVSGNGGAQEVIIREAATRLLVATATPDETTGDWTADVPPGDYDITYFAPDCQPICHGPYTVTA